MEAVRVPLTDGINYSNNGRTHNLPEGRSGQKPTKSLHEIYGDGLLQVNKTPRHVFRASRISALLNDSERSSNDP